MVKGKHLSDRADVLIILVNIVEWHGLSRSCFVLVAVLADTLSGDWHFGESWAHLNLLDEAGVQVEAMRFVRCVSDVWFRVFRAKLDLQEDWLGAM